MTIVTRIGNGTGGGPGGGRSPRVGAASLTLALLFWAGTATAQQTGRIEGTVTLRGAASPEGIGILAETGAVPRPRSTVTDASGHFALPRLYPGLYRVTFTTPAGASRTVEAQVWLGQTTTLSLELDAAVAAVSEELVVIGERVAVRGRAAVASAIDGEAVRDMPLGPDYRSLVRLAPGVQVTQDSVRGPAGGGSGQDNVYRFDGVDVSLPMFGTLSAELSSHDVDQVTFERAGATAVGFNRSGGFTMDSTARSGTNAFAGSVEYTVEPRGLRAEPETALGPVAGYDTDRQRAVATFGGPIVPSRLFFFASAFRPAEERTNAATAYGPVKDYENTRREFYGRLTHAPSDQVLLNAGFRTSRREENGVSVGAYEADSVSLGGRADQRVANVDGVWQTGVGALSFRFSDYELEGSSRPDVALAVQPALDGALDLENLDRMGYFSVPEYVDGADAYNAAVGPLVERYGYVDGHGARRGGGAVGAHPLINDQAFYRRSFELSFDHHFDRGATGHDLHLGFRAAEARETLSRESNGWGAIESPGGVDLAEDGTPVFYVATVQQMSLRRPDGTVVSPIDSFTETTSLEVHDRLTAGDFTFDAGVLLSEDVLFGQGLRAASGTVSGFALAPGEKYRMYRIDWRDMIQPRLGVTWSYGSAGTVFANYARYHPEASSLARAASWDRNTRASLRVLFDESGRIISHEPYPGSSGKVFQDGMKPRRIDEWTLGATRTLSQGLSLNAHLRRREGGHFWEDTWNGSRGYDSAPDHIAARGLYVPGLDAVRAEIGGSSYVIAELDGAYTEYSEAAVELVWRGRRGYLNASYVRSRYTGNFDQDNTSWNNDANLFIGSSNLADGYGRQVWDSKDGTLRGDRPHLAKLFARLDLPWRASVGAFVFFQSGQPWEAWDSVAYGLPSYFSSTNRYAEQAGSRRSPSHWQLDLGYTQRFRLSADLGARLRVDLFNLFDRQTGYNMNPFRRDAAFGEPRDRFDPRRVQISLSVEF